MRPIDRYCKLYGCGAQPNRFFMTYCVLCGRYCVPDGGLIKNLVRILIELPTKILVRDPPVPVE